MSNPQGARFRAPSSVSYVVGLFAEPSDAASRLASALAAERSTRSAQRWLAIP
jgi:hypothetical protein